MTSPSIRVLARAIHKRSPPITQDIEAHQERAVDGRAGRFIDIAMKSIFDPVPEQKLVTKHLLMTVENRLSCHIAQRFRT